MKRIVGLVCALVLLSLVPAAPGAIKITKIYFDSPGSDTGSNSSLNAEWIRLKNTGNRAKSLRGWKITDASGHRYRFGRYRLAAGKTVTIHTGRGSNRPRHRYWRQDWYVWNNDGDRAKLRNRSGRLIDRCSYSGSGDWVAC